jgi:transmembrane sensor
MEKPSADFSSYTLEDLIDDPRFILWVLTPDEEISAFWESVQNEYPQLIPVIVDAKKIVHSLRFSREEMTAAEQQSLWANISDEAKLYQEIAIPVVKHKAVSSRQQPVFRIPVWLRASAAVLLFGLLGISIFLYQQQQQTVITTAFGQTRNITLPDGSVITLNANSKLHYAKEWDTATVREVWIDGEAFFKVNHLHRTGPIQSAQRFIVHAQQLDVEVLGTTFNVKNRRGQINVALVAGKVGVKIEGKNKPLLKLSPGELAAYAGKGDVIRKQKVDITSYTSWQDGELHFNKTPLREIFDLIEDTYGYRVITKNQQIGERQLSGTFLLSSEDAFFKAITTSLGISFQKNEATHQLIIK